MPPDVEGSSGECLSAVQASVAQPGRASNFVIRRPGVRIPPGAPKSKGAGFTMKFEKQYFISKNKLLNL